MRLHAGNTLQFARARAEVADARSAPDWFHYQRLADGSTYLRWTGLFEFLVSSDGRQILYRRRDRATRESLSVYLFGQVLSFSLLAFGVETLHGTVVEINGRAVAFVGNCGYGKSTIGAALLARGFPILTDDLIALEQRYRRWTVHPGIPRLKLFPSVARTLLGSNGVGTPMHDRTPKLVLPLSGNQAARRAMRLKAIYVLSDPEEAANSRSMGVRIERLSGGPAFLEVIRSAFNLVVVHSDRLANQFKFASRLVAIVPVRRLVYPRDLSVLPAVCKAVLADLDDTN